MNNKPSSVTTKPKMTPDIIVVGSGTAGISVVLHLVERVKKGLASFNEILLLQTRPILGIDQSSDTITNTHTNAMGIYNASPNDNTLSVESREYRTIPPQQETYLETKFTKVIEDATTLGLQVNILQQEARDIENQADDSVSITLGNGDTIRANIVVLALGNLANIDNAKVADSDEYDSSPSSATQPDTISSVTQVEEVTRKDCVADQINSPLIQAALAKGILKGQQSAGNRIDIKGVHLIGSLPKGKQFYAGTTHRIEPHASQIADALINQPAIKSLRVALLLGSDLFSHLMASKLVPQLLHAGHMPYIFLVHHKKSIKVVLPELQELAFFERELLQDYVIPYFKDKITSNASHLTVHQLQANYGILVEEVSNVNGEEFIQTLATHQIDIGLSLRVYQRFKTNVIRYFSSRKKLFNLHPGDLPAYRGVMTTVRAMKNKETHFGYSLHEVNEQWDAGDVVEIRKSPIDYSKSMLHYMNDVYCIGVEIALDVIDMVARGQPLPAVPQDTEKSNYYTFPTREEFDDYRRCGIRLVDAARIVEIIVDSFGSRENYDDFKKHILDAVYDWNDERNSKVPESILRNDGQRLISNQVMV